MVFLVNFSRIVFAPLVQPAAADFDVTPASLGVVTSAAWLGSAAPRLPTGWILTRIDRHVVVAGSGGFLVLAAAFTALSASVLHLTLGAFLMGLSSGMYFIAALPLVSELFPDRLGRVLGLHGTSNQLASVSAPLVIGAVLLVGPWQLTFVLVAGLAAVTTVLFVWTARRTTLPDAGIEDRSLGAAVRAQWPLLVTGLAFVGAVGFCWNALFNLYGDYLTVAKGIDPGTGRLLLSAMFAAGIPAFLLSGRLVDRLPSVPMLLSVGTGFTVCALALTLAEGRVAVAVISLFLGLSYFSLYPAMDAYLLSSLPDHHRASAYSAYSASMMFVQAWGSGTVGTLVSGGVSYTVAFQSLVVVVGATVAVLAVLFRAGKLPSGASASADRAGEPSEL